MKGGVEHMKKIYKIIIGAVVIILVVMGIVFMVKKEQKREIVLTDFKYGQEYQFGALDWHTTLEEVEKYLKCSLTIEPAMASVPQGYAFYRLDDISYVLGGYSANTRIEFQNDGLSMIQFTIKPESTEGVLEEIVGVLHENFGTESGFFEENGIIGYQWKTDNTMLQINYSNSMIYISVGTLQ